MSEHPVITRLRARRGGAAPFHDGRKIALVLYGGIMLGVRGAGALLAIEEAGLGRTFDEIYTMSSGFLNGSYFVSGQIADAFAMYADEFSGKKFLNPRRFWKPADIAYLLSVAKERRPLDIAAALANPTRLSAMLVNADKGGQEYLEVHRVGAADYPNLVRAAASLPFVGWGATRIGGTRYRDIFRDHNLPDLMRHVLATDATDVLALYNYPWQKEYVDAKVGITGAEERLFEYCPCPEPMSRFETDAAKLRATGEDARRRMAELLRA